MISDYLHAITAKRLAGLLAGTIEPGWTAWGNETDRFNDAAGTPPRPVNAKGEGA